MNIRPIKDDASYQWALAEIEPYFVREPEPGSPEADRFDVLAALIEAYEARVHLADEDGPARQVVLDALEKHVAGPAGPIAEDDASDSRTPAQDADITCDRAVALGQMIEEACKVGTNLPDKMRHAALGRFAYGCAMDEATRARGLGVN